VFAPLLCLLLAAGSGWGCQSEAADECGDRVTLQAEVAAGPQLRVYDATLEFAEWDELPLDGIDGFTPSTTVGTTYSLLCLRTVAQTSPTRGYAYRLLQVMATQAPSLPADGDANHGFNEGEEL